MTDMKFAVNNQIVTEPFVDTGIEAKVSSGFASISQKATLRSLKVLVGSTDIPTGAVVYLNAENYVQAWAKKKFKQADIFDGKEFIVIPSDVVIFWEWISS